MGADIKRNEAVLEELLREDLPVAVRSWRAEETEDWAGEPARFVWTLLEPGGILPGGKIKQRNALRGMVIDRIRDLAGDALVYVIFNEAKTAAPAP